MPAIATAPKTALIAGATKTLQLARPFHAAGHRAIVIDTGKFWLRDNRFSNAVAGFYTVVDPAKDGDAYGRSLRAIAETEQVDLFIPVAIFAAIYPDGVTNHPFANFRVNNCSIKTI